MDRRLRLVLAAALCAPVPAWASQADFDHDGYVTYVEAKAVLYQLPQVHFNKFDTDGDGRLTPSQYIQLSNFYRMMNTNR